MRNRVSQSTLDSVAERSAQKTPPPGPSEGPGPVVVPALAEESLWFDGPFREFEYNGGVHLAESVLWCDTDRRGDLSFISSGRFGAPKRARRVLASQETLALVTRGRGKLQALTSPFGRRFTLGPLELELHPAGGVLGASQLLIERAGRRVVYAGDLHVRPTLTAAVAKPLQCDVLAVAATYGDPTFSFPARDAVLAEIERFVQDALSDKATPVLVAEPVGLAQEVLALLDARGYRLRAHRAVHEVTRVYQELGVELGKVRRFSSSLARDEVLVFPPILRRHASIRKLRDPRIGWVTPRAVEPGFAALNRVDAAFALSDAVDHHELIAAVQASGAKEVFVTAGAVEPVVEALRGLGIRAYSLVKPEQLALF